MIYKVFSILMFIEGMIIFFGIFFFVNLDWVNVIIGNFRFIDVWFLIVVLGRWIFCLIVFGIVRKLMIVLVELFIRMLLFMFYS